MKQWFMALLLCLFMATDALADPVRVRDFCALVDVSGNGDIVVFETLSVDIPESGSFHGLFRDIPVVTRWREQGRASMQVLEVRIDGRSLSINDVERSSGMVRVYQRDRERTLSPGRHEFFLSYRMTGQTGLFESNDELTWNVTGSGWEAPVDRASCTVLCPPGAPFFGQKAWLGKPGSRNSPVDMSHDMKNGRLVMRFTAQRAVMPGEEFTVAAGWQKGFVVLDRTTGSRWGTWLLAVLDGAVLLYFFLAWFFTGRDPKKGVIVPLFHPPFRHAADGKRELISPAVAGYLFHKTEVTPGCFGAAVISLAGRGCCRIEGNAKDGFVLERGSGTSPHAEENRILEHLEGRVPVDKEHGETLSAMRRAMGAQLRKDCGNMWRGAGGGSFKGLFGSVWTFLGMAATVILLAAAVGYITGGIVPERAVSVLVLMLFFSFLFRRFFRGTVQLFRSRRYGPFAFFLLFQTGMLVFSGFFIVTVCRDSLDFLTPLQTVLCALSLLVPMLFSCIMDAPTKEARAMLDDIEGLALYIRMAEGPALNALNPPQRTLDHYRELLPYAVALGMERAWGAHFSSLLSAAAVSESQVLTPSLAGAFSSEADRSASSFEGAQSSSASSSSSFGDGGGGAGSGGGGGGGGGC